MPSSCTLSESLFLQRILVSALPGLHSLVQATSHLGTEEATGPGMHTAAPNLSQADIFQWKVGSHQPHSLEPLPSSHCSRDKAKAITSDLLLPERFAFCTLPYPTLLGYGLPPPPLPASLELLQPTPAFPSSALLAPQSGKESMVKATGGSFHCSLSQHHGFSCPHIHVT